MTALLVPPDVQDRRTFHLWRTRTARQRRALTPAVADFQSEQMARSDPADQGEIPLLDSESYLHRAVGEAAEADGGDAADSLTAAASAEGVADAAATEAEVEAEAPPLSTEEAEEHAAQEESEDGPEGRVRRAHARIVRTRIVRPPPPPSPPSPTHAHLRRLHKACAER